MEPFEYNGVWWTADNPSVRVGGVLRLSGKGAIVLSLLGSFGAVGSRVGAKRFDIVHGLVVDSTLGDEVTLTDCRQSRQTMRSSGLNSESYFAERAFFGSHLNTPEEFRFPNCTLQISGLSMWALHRTGFRADDDQGGAGRSLTFRIAYATPPSLKAPIPGGEVSLDITATMTQALRNQSVEEKASFGIQTASSLTEHEWNRRYVYPLLNFLTLATDTPNALTEWKLGDFQTTCSSVTVVGPRVFKGKPEEADPTSLGLLIPLEGNEERFPTLIARWLATAETYHDACSVFFALWYAPPAYLDMRLLGITQALELYHARRLNRPPLTSETFGETLAHIAEEHQAILSALSPGSAVPLILELVEFRNHALHRTAPPVSTDTYSHGLYLATETFSYLMKACLLAELGFTEEERAGLFEKNAMFGFLRHEWTRRWAAPG